MRASPLPALILLVVVLAAGCAAPETPTPTTPVAATGAIDLTGKMGLLAIELSERRVTALTERPGPAWISPGGDVVVWLDDSFSVVVNEAAGTRDVGARVTWARVHDNATGLEILPGEARIRDLVGGALRSNATLPPAPATGAAWTAASEDLSVLAAEYDAGRPSLCANDLFLRGAANARTIGCHLRVSPDGRIGWTETLAVRVMGADGEIRNVTGPPTGDAAQGNFVAHENPAFTADGVLYLRLTGGSQLTRTEVVREDGTALATLAGPRRLALVDASADGDRLLVRVFER